MALKNKSGLDTLQNKYKNEDTKKSEPISKLDQKYEENKQLKVKDKKQKYLRLDITNYQDYVSLMAEYETEKTGKYISMTRYILQLIESDKQKNCGLYEKLEKIEQMKRDLI